MSPGKDTGSTVQSMAQGSDSTSPVWRTERCEKNAEFVACYLEVSGCCQRGLDKRAPFIGSALVIRGNQVCAVTLGLISNHLDKVREEFALGVELDNVYLNNVADHDPGRHRRAFPFEF